MRITNRMMTTNMLNDINRNKKNVNTLGYQYNTLNKIAKPSEDPVVAVRSLKFRTQISELVQYVEKNIPDAKAWMDVTEDAMVEMNSVLEQVSTYCNEGANDTMEEKNRSSIIETLEQYKEQIYSQANSDYAGRYVFTGFRTDKPLLFNKTMLNEQQLNHKIYTIDEPLNFDNITRKSFVKGGASYAAGTTGDQYAQDAPTMETANRLQLSYTNLDKGPTLNTTVGGNTYTRNTGIQSITFTNPLNENDVLTLQGDGAPVNGYKITTKSLKAGEQGDCYQPGDREIIFIPETGELIFGKEAFSMAQKNSNFNVKYTKSEFAENDIIPEHYFECTTNSIVVDRDNGGYKQETIGYTNPETQKIDYEINFSQKLTVNTLAKDAVSTSVGTKIEELIRDVNAVFDLDDKLSEVTKLMESTTDETEKKNLESLKEQLETEQTLKKTILRETFGSGITMVKETQSKLNVSLANHGSRYLRLQLTESRLQDQKVTFKELQGTNDKVDLEDAIINFKQAQTVYDASLSCTSTIVTKTLLNYL